jgi:hypothetical protein
VILIARRTLREWPVGCRSRSVSRRQACNKRHAGPGSSPACGANAWRSLTRPRSLATPGVPRTRRRCAMSGICAGRIEGHRSADSVAALRGHASCSRPRACGSHQQAGHMGF